MDVYEGTFLEIGKVYDIQIEDTIGYYLKGHGWVIKECISIIEFRELQIKEILNDTSLEM